MGSFLRASYLYLTVVGVAQFCSELFWMIADGVEFPAGKLRFEEVVESDIDSQFERQLGVCMQFIGELSEVEVEFEPATGSFSIEGEFSYVCFHSHFS